MVRCFRLESHFSSAALLRLAILVRFGWGMGLSRLL